MADPTSAAPPTAPPASNTPAQPPVVVKKYANRRLYNTETSSYITLDNLAEMIRHGRDFVVYDAKSSEDITRGVLTQIIVEEESKGTSMLPTPFLRQLIGFYGGSLQGVVPRYLETAMSSFAQQQQQLREVVQQTFRPFLPAGVEEMSRQNLAAIERTMSLFNPFHRGSTPLPPAPEAQTPEMPSSAEPEPVPVAAPPSLLELDRLRHEVETLRSELAAARAEAALSQGPEEPRSVTLATMDATPVESPTRPEPPSSQELSPPALNAGRKSSRKRPPASPKRR